MNTTTGTKSAEIKIERIVSRMKRSHYMLSFSATQRKTEAEGWVIDWQVRDAGDELLVAAAYPVKTPIVEVADLLNEEIKSAREARELQKEAEREALLARPATTEEKLAFERLMSELEWAVRRYASAADSMRTKIDNGEDLYSSVHEELIKAQSELNVMRRIRYVLLSNKSIVKTLTEIEELCDRETSFYMPSRSSSAVNNMQEDHKHAHMLKMGRIARLRSEY
jgi:hypothetical protein